MSNKSNSSNQSTWLRELFHRWQSNTIGRPGEDAAADGSSIMSPMLGRRLLQESSPAGESDEECGSPDCAHSVPKGYLAVYVGPERRRFVIPTKCLSSPVFRVLLEKVEEEFGFDHNGALTLPCEVETFKYLLQHMEINTSKVVQQHKENAEATPSASPPTTSSSAVKHRKSE